MEKSIEVDIFEKNDLFERYNRKKVSKSLINYIIEETPDFRKEDKLKIIINSKLDESIDYKNLIKQNLNDEYVRSFRKHLHIGIIQFLYLIVGVIILFISTLIDGEVFREVVLICGWVLIWAMAELEIFSDMEGRKKRRTLKKLLHSDFIVNEI